MRAQELKKEWFSKPTPWSRTQRALCDLLETFEYSHAVAENRLLERVLEMRPNLPLTSEQEQWWARLRSLSILRGLVFGKQSGRRVIYHAFAYTAEARPMDAMPSGRNHFEAQDFLEAATRVSGLYWELYRSCEGEFFGLESVARKLYEEIFAKPYESKVARHEIANLTDQMQDDGGISFFVLNSVRRGGFSWIKAIAPTLLHAQSTLSDETRTALFWLSEVLWFVSADEVKVLDATTALRYWTHLCLTNPERIGFLEIENPFSENFEQMTEMAREGFAFREHAIGLMFDLWKSYEGPFNRVFTDALRELTSERSKVLRDRAMWLAWWRRDRETFLSDLFFWIEGNLSFSRKEYTDAVEFYDRALEAGPRRGVERNRAFALAYLGDAKRLRAQLTALTTTNATAQNWLVAALCSQIAGDGDSAKVYLEELRAQAGWQERADWVFSSFCLEQGYVQIALEHAEFAAAADPGNPLVIFHLAQCWKDVGNLEKALQVLPAVTESADEEPWMAYFRFSLQRDLGRFEDAVETLRLIPDVCFDDPEILAQAIDFARGRSDLSLLRRLREFSRKSV